MAAVSGLAADGSWTTGGCIPCGLAPAALEEISGELCPGRVGQLAHGIEVLSAAQCLPVRARRQVNADLPGVEPLDELLQRTGLRGSVEVGRDDLQVGTGQLLAPDVGKELRHTLLARPLIRQGP